MSVVAKPRTSRKIAVRNALRNIPWSSRKSIHEHEDEFIVALSNEGYVVVRSSVSAEELRRDLLTRLEDMRNAGIRPTAPGELMVWNYTLNDIKEYVEWWGKTRGIEDEQE